MPKNEDSFGMLLGERKNKNNKKQTVDTDFQFFFENFKLDSL